VVDKKAKPVLDKKASIIIDRTDKTIIVNLKADLGEKILVKFFI
jgi:hypothetical protein